MNIVDNERELSVEEMVAQLMKVKEDRLSGAKTQWIKDLFTSKSIEIKIQHETNFKYVTENESPDKAFKYFMDSFRNYLGFLNEDQIELLKKGELAIPSDNLDTCFECGETVKYLFNGKSIKDIQMKYENGDFVESESKCSKVGIYSVDIAIPSGILMCADWLPYASELLKHLDTHGHSINTNLGVFERVNRYAEVNVLHMFVGNTCPRVYYKDGLVVVGMSGYKDLEGNDEDEDYDIEDEDENEIPPLEGGKCIESICTDLWWATIVDSEIYKKLLIDKFGEADGLVKFNEIEKVSTPIKKGVYKCTYFGRGNDDDNSPHTFFNMEWVKEI